MPEEASIESPRMLPNRKRGITSEDNHGHIPYLKQSPPAGRMLMDASLSWAFYLSVHLIFPVNIN
jgi:hypothetical protein